MSRAHLSRRSLALAAAAATLGATFYGVGAATADNSVPRSDKEIPNLTDVVNEIKAYYGDTVDASGEHFASADSSYAHQLAGIEAKAKSDLARALHKGGHGGQGKPAIVLDVDDTSVITYNYELEVGFNYTPASNQAYLDSKDIAGGLRHGHPRQLGRGPGRHGLLDHRPPGVPARRHRTQPDRGRLQAGARHRPPLPEEQGEPMRRT